MTDLTPIDITQREFTRSFRGLDPVEVKSFLDTVAEELQRLLKANVSQEERIRNLEIRLQMHQQREREVNEALFAVQRMADEMKDKSHKESELILKDAEIKAQNLLGHAHLMLGQMQAKIGDLKRQKALFEGRIRAAIKLHQDLLAAEAAEDMSGPIDPKPPYAGG